VAEALLRRRAEPAASAPTAAQLVPILGKPEGKGGERTGPSLGTSSVAPVAYPADLGFAGRHWQRQWDTDDGASARTKRDVRDSLGVQDRPAAEHRHASSRQVVETVNTFLDRFPGLKFPNAGTYWGLLTRYLNHLHHRPPSPVPTPSAHAQHTSGGAGGAAPGAAGARGGRSPPGRQRAPLVAVAASGLRPLSTPGVGWVR
jgi:hypothetical protein